MSISSALFILTLLCVGLMAGLFFSFSIAVMPGLKQLQDADFATAMQSINRKIQNPVFFIVFFGALILLPLNTYHSFTQPLNARFWLLLAATVIYLLGVFLTTVMGNIPLNNSLDKLDILSASKENINLLRNTFENKWNLLNNIRTLASTASFLLCIIACIMDGARPGV